MPWTAARSPGIGGRWWIGGALALAFTVLAFLRPVDHDESQYVAAAVLTAHGLLPYRDYAYLQTPLQPFALSPVAALAGAWAWPALRLVNALLGAVTVIATGAAARAGGASRRMAMVAGGLFAGCDIFLFSIGTARNDALPAACLAIGLWLAIRNERDATRTRAAAIGLFLAAAAAAKISYALPAAAYGVMTLIRWKRLPAWVLLGAAPVIGFVGWTLLIAPENALWGMITFPSVAPADWYADRPWKLSGWAKLLDVVKFLALGAALPALVYVASRGRNIVWWLMIAGLAAALLPTPTWRQYLLPALPPMFVLLALHWTRAAPERGWRAAFGVFAIAGLVPTAAALIGGNAMLAALRDGAAVRVAMDHAGIRGPVVSLSPQYVTLAGRLPDPRFATGPFAFRGRAIVPRGEEARLMVVPHARVSSILGRNAPPAILTGAEAFTSGDPRLDAILVRWATANGYSAVAAGQLTLWVRARTPS